MMNVFLNFPLYSFIDNFWPQTQQINKTEFSDYCFRYVEDVDDNAPVMTQTLYEATVPENSPQSTFVLQLSAVDLDIVSCFIN